MKILRLATAADATAILAIYTPYILRGAVTFETEIPDIESFRSRIVSCLENFPWLVYEIDGSVAGYAYAGKYRDRAAYQWSIESSIYIDEPFQRSGIARALYTVLLDILRLQGFRNVYAVVTVPNPRSVGFHERMGFRYFTTFEKVGFKEGRWHDVGWWLLTLNEFSASPDPPLKFRDLGREQVEKILIAASQ